ncbi:MAG: DUF3000 domain-containing protein [Sciscionella sp.]
MTEIAGAPELFRQAVATMSAVRPRAEIELTEIRPPQRLAPFSYALGAEATSPQDDLATGRLILLHDPDAPESWHGVLRLVAYIRAELDAELASDPMLPEVGWSWLTEALETTQASASSLGGTVTRTSSARFGDIAGPTRTDDVELRASWTALDGELAAHADAFCAALASMVGLPPVGVVLLTHRHD